VVIDMMCYRVHGHNEGDEPTFTQPLLYEKIEEKRSPRKLYTEMLLRRGDIEPDEAEQMLDDYRSRLQEAFERTKDLEEKDAEEALEKRTRPEEDVRLPSADTTAEREHLERVVEVLTDFPDAFNVHPKLKRQFDKRDDLFYEQERIDWAFAEALAFGSLLQEGTRVRLSGQDSRRATFSQRHAVLIDQETGEEYTPLNHLSDDQARLLIYDSLLSEYAVCGFEYGYSVMDRDALVCWEAQFGDFANGAQIVWDQFVSAAEQKWGQTSGLVALLPHAYEGQGPEHSSARLQRFLQLCAEQNIIVANFSTPANYFHALRRQVKRDVKKPLIVMTPKSLLRHPLCDGRGRAGSDSGRGGPGRCDASHPLQWQGVLRPRAGAGGRRPARRDCHYAAGAVLSVPRGRGAGRARTLRRGRRDGVGAGGAEEHGRLDLRAAPPRRPARRAPRPVRAAHPVCGAPSQRQPCHRLRKSARPRAGDARPGRDRRVVLSPLQRERLLLGPAPGRDLLVPTSFAL